MIEHPSKRVQDLIISALVSVHRCERIFRVEGDELSLERLNEAREALDSLKGAYPEFFGGLNE